MNATLSRLLRVLCLVLVAVFCLGAGGCFDTGTNSDNSGSGGGSGTNPPPSSDYTQYWVGHYNGSATLYWYTTGSTWSNKSAKVDISKAGQDQIHFYILVDATTTNSATGGTYTVSSESSVNGEYQSGNLKGVISISKSGGSISGELRQFRQRSDGGYDPYNTYSFTVQ